MQFPEEILKKVKLLEIKTRKLVNSVYAGEYHTAFKGQGMTFSDFREYVPGDDVRSISWPLTARAGKPYIKKFDEERELSVILAVDVSGSLDYGSGQWFKMDVVTHICALLAFSAAKNKDQVGLCLFSEQVEHFVPPVKGRGQVHRLLRDLYYFKPKSRRTRIQSSLDFLQGVLKKRSVVFVISDFADQSFETSLKRLGKKHDVVAVVVEDPTEMQLPNLGVVEMSDPETGEMVLVDTSSAIVRRDFEAQVNAIKSARDQMLKKSQVGRIDIDTSADYSGALIKFFKGRRG